MAEGLLQSPGSFRTLSYLTLSSWLGEEQLGVTCEEKKIKSETGLWGLEMYKAEYQEGAGTELVILRAGFLFTYGQRGCFPLFLSMSISSSLRLLYSIHCVFCKHRA